MAEERAKFQTVDPDHRVSQVAHALVDNAPDFTGSVGLSQMEFCVAMANACGMLLADAATKTSRGGKPLPRDEALKRMDDLRQVMEGAYNLRGVGGSA